MFKINKFWLNFTFCIFFSIYNNAYGYNFYVETSEFADRVSVIEDVIKTGNKNKKEIVDIDEGSALVKNNNKILTYQKQLIIKDDDERDLLSNRKSKVCTNLYIKHPEILKKDFIKNKMKNGLSTISLRRAENFWNNQEALDVLDNCGQITEDLLINSANILNKIVQLYNFTNININKNFPKIAYVNLVDINNDSYINKTKKEKYLESIFDEIRVLRKELLKHTDNNIILDYYYESLIEKENKRNLNNNELKFIFEYHSNKINLKIKEVKKFKGQLFTESGFINNSETYRKNISIERKIEFLEDISPIIEFYILTLSTSEKEKLKNKNLKHGDNRKSTMLLNEFSQALNNL